MRIPQSPQVGNRITSIILLLVTIAMGLLSRSSWVPSPSFFAEYAGDTLWAMAVYWGCAMLLPRLPVSYLVAAALAISFTVELSQLYQAPWINQIRANRLGALVLGFTFFWIDLVCYTVGVIGAGLIDLLWVRREKQSRPS